MEFAGQNVLVLGLGVSGRSAARFLLERGARVVAADERPASAIAGLDTLPEEITQHLGQPFPNLADFDLIVPSPGIPVARYESEARRAWGDIELCGRALSAPIIAVTGTNGKSTVVRLIEAMARAAGLRAQAAGNLGLPALELVKESLDLAILEVSSFQLESVERFRPRVGVLLNITPDHLDRHGDFKGYCEAKARLFAQQEEGDTAIVNGDDPAAAALLIPGSAERLEFRRTAGEAPGAWIEGRNLIVRRAEAADVQKIALGDATPGGQADENVVAALLALSSLEPELKIDLAAAAGALASFQGLPHRCQLVRELGGVRYFDDSKATNLGAAARSLETVQAPIIWIAGGRHKGGDLTPLVTAAQGRVRRALLIGEAADELATAIGHEVDCESVGTLEAAVHRAAALAQPGEAVLLAPACASFDQFSSFEERGRCFQSAVASLPPALSVEATATQRSLGGAA